MGRARIHPFAQGTAERVLFDRFRRDVTEAEKHEKQATLFSTRAAAHRASAERYAEALRALGHGDKVTPLLALVDQSETRK